MSLDPHTTDVHAVPCTASLGRMFARGLRKHCVCCGGGRLFDGWLKMKAECPTCGYRFEREEGFFLGAFVLSFAVMQATVGICIAAGLVLTLPDPPVGLLAAVTSAVVTLVIVGFYPFSKTIWAAFDVAFFQRDETRGTW